MNRNIGADSGSLPQRAWLFVMVGVLSAVVLAVAYVQWRQYKLLDTAAHFQNDALGWSFSQLETEQLRLTNEMQRYLADPQHRGVDKVQLRYDIFVSRISLVDHPRAAGIMQDQMAYQPAMAQVRAFIKQADVVLGQPPVEPLSPANAQQLLAHLDALNVPLHDLSLGASHLLYQRATDRNLAVRQQSELGVALTVFQVVLLIALAMVVLRQLRTLTERRINLEALAASLSAARQGAEAANRAKSAFLANMSHEIRTPFHGMLGMMSLLQDSGLAPKQAVYLDTARESAHHLLTILNDILDISQLESGKLQVSPQTVDLLQLVHQVDSLMRAQALAKGLALRVDVAPDVPRWVRADPTRVRQILFNLLSNALKFTSDGEVALLLTNGAPGHIDFAVLDSGIGMDEPTQARLFQRFMQGDERPSRRTSGTGLGLQISRDLARLMGGDIAVHSAPGQGSRFTVSLPLASVGAPALSAADSSQAADAAVVRPLRVLVAEDHAVNRAYLEAVLEKLGHRGRFVTDGHAAVEAVQSQPLAEMFDIVLMDLHMPDMDGFTAARTIRAMAAPRGRVPIVALTADAFQISRELARDAGMEGFLTKPAHLPQLREALQRYGSGVTAFAAADVTLDASAAPLDEPTVLLDIPTIQDVSQALTPRKYSELLGRFLDSRSVVVAELRQAAAVAAHADLRSAAHSLKGASASLGLCAVSAVAQRLQSSTPHAPTHELMPLLDELDTAFERSVAECVRSGLIDATGDATGDAGGVRPPAARAPA